MRESLLIHLLSDALGSLLIIVEFILWVTDSIDQNHLRTFDSTTTMIVSVIMISVCLNSLRKMILSSKRNDYEIIRIK